MNPAQAILNLQSDNWRSRMDAADALSGMTEADAVQALITALGDPDWGVRRCALHALGNGDPAAFSDKIAPLMADPHSVVRETAASILKSAGEKGAKQFFKILADQDKYPRSIRLCVLRWLDPDTLWNHSEIVARLLEQETDRLIRSELQSAVDEKSKCDWIPEADDPAETVAEKPLPTAEELVSYLKNGNAYERKKAAELLFSFSGEPVIAALIEALHDRIWHVARSAEKSLAQIGRAALQQLEAAVDQYGTDASFRIQALLDSLESETGQAHLRVMINDAKKKTQAVRALDAGDRDNLPLLLSLLDDPDPSIVYMVIEKFEDNPVPEALPLLLTLLEKQIAASATPEGKRRISCLKAEQEQLLKEQHNRLKQLDGFFSSVTGRMILSKI